MNISSTSSFLRRVLLADAATSCASGLLMALAAVPLENMLGIPSTLLRYAGLSLLPFAALIAYLATRRSLPRSAVWAVIALNALWVADSLLLLVGGWVGPTTFGYVFVIAQALVVAAFAEFEYVGLRKSPAAAA